MAVLLIPVFLFANAASAGDYKVKLNCSERFWYPFLYTQSSQVKGIFYDMVRKAFENLNIEASIVPVPFRRAIVNANKGRVDGVLAIGYRPDMIQDLDYPPGTALDIESPWRILQVDHVVVTIAYQDYEYEGDLRTLPEPVRLLQGAPIIENLNKVGIVAQEVREDLQNFLKLIRDKNGVIITTSVTAEMMNRDKRFKGRIKIHAMPVASHSYYLVFSKKSALPTDERRKNMAGVKAS